MGSVVSDSQHSSTPYPPIILVTNAGSSGSARNPWEDSVDLLAGRILYWGDAKFGTSTVDQFEGNQAMRAAWEQVLDNNRSLIPPILHFSRVKTGEVLFNGLCVLDHLELTWFEDPSGRPVRNYRAHLTILDEEFVDVAWLHRRSSARAADDLLHDGPDSWRRYQAGFVDRLRIWAPQIRSQEAQLPAAGSRDVAILEQLIAMSPTHFEAAVVSLFREMRTSSHHHAYTADARWGVRLLRYVHPSASSSVRNQLPGRSEEVRAGKCCWAEGRFSPRRSTRPRTVRTVRDHLDLHAATQEEVLSDAYPASLISGGDLVRMMRELRIARAGVIAAEWLRAVESEATYGLIGGVAGTSR